VEVGKGQGGEPVFEDGVGEVVVGGDGGEF
jgi:hypothetical protein